MDKRREKIFSGSIAELMFSTGNTAVRSITSLLAAVLIFTLSSCGSDFSILLEDLPKSDGTETAPDDPGTQGDDPGGSTDKLKTLFWCESDGDIRSILTDKSGETLIYTDADGTPLDISVLDSTGTVYWATDNKKIKRINGDGSGYYTPLIITNASMYGPQALATDNNASMIYWERYNDNPPAGNSEIFREDITLTDFTGTAWMSDTFHHYIHSVSLDTGNGKIYFTSNTYYYSPTPLGSGNTGSLYVNDIGTADNESVLVSDTGPAAPSVAFRGVAIDSAGGHIFYVLNSASSLDIWRADLSGAGSEKWIHANSFDINKITLDTVKRKIYWTDMTNMAVYRADLDIKESNIEVFLSLDSGPTGIIVSGQ